MRNLENYSNAKQKTFERVLRTNNLSESPVSEKIQKLFELAVTYKKQSIEIAQKLKTEIYDKASSSVVLNEKMFNTFISIIDKVAEGKNVDNTVDKLIEKNLENKYVAATTKAFIDGYVYNPTGDDFKLPDFEDVISETEDDKELKVSTSTLMEVLKEGAREKANMSAIKRYVNDINLTLSILVSTDDEEIKPAAIAKIVDMEVTKDGFPDGEQKPKMYSLIEHLNTTLRLYNKLGLNTFNEKLEKFGLSVKEESPFSTSTKWTKGLVEIDDHGNYMEF